MSRTTADNYYICLETQRQSLGLDGVAAEFERRQRCAATDGDHCPLSIPKFIKIDYN